MIGIPYLARRHRHRYRLSKTSAMKLVKRIVEHMEKLGERISCRSVSCRPFPGQIETTDAGQTSSWASIMQSSNKKLDEEKL